MLVTEPKTQKAKGIVALQKYTYKVPKHTVYSVKDIAPESLSLLVDKFVRPCPMRPRHGFVDSRVIHNLDEAQAIVKETLAADPDAEFVVMPFVPADYSGIWTTGSLAIGRGTDGATAGTSAITFPTIGSIFGKPYWDEKVLFYESGVQSAPYLELLWQGSNNQFVQLRDGPTIPQSVDYIPEKTEVKHIIPAVGELLEWETQMKQVAPNTVVHHPNGSLASHYSIHAILNKIPVVISHEPKVGEVLLPSAESPEPNVKAVRAGFYVACQHKMDYKEAAQAMLSGVHHIALWRGKHDFVLGFALGAAYRLTVTAALGELRHKPDGRFRDFETQSEKRSYMRDSIYESAWDNILAQEIRTKFQNALVTFLKCHWPGSYGGPSWFKFAHWAAIIYNEVLAGNIDSALEALNQVVHSAHNTGWGFDKFILESVMTDIAANPATSLLTVAPMFYQVITENADKLSELAHQFKYHRRRLTLPEYEIVGSSVIALTPAMKALKTVKEAKAQVTLYSGTVAHIQYHEKPGETYKKVDVVLSPEQQSVYQNITLVNPPYATSMSEGSSTKYYLLNKTDLPNVFALGKLKFDLKEKTCQMIN